ncbi:MAG: polymerase, sigma-24 subunit, subfamily [Verrucomicrobia bacterium]|nr:polymerase, sigma-24 subunit, subfamily [Verrucomicrobiota bacterium]
MFVSTSSTASAATVFVADNDDTQPVITSAAAIDNELVRRFLNKDEAAFVEIMTRHRGKIFSVVVNLLRNHADAEEITQDTFVRAYHGLPRFRGDSSFATWLYRIAVNLARNRYWYFFRRRRQDSLSLDSALSENSASSFADLVADTGLDPAQETITKEFSTLVDRCMANLEEGHRQILTLRTVLNQSYEEIAQAMGLKIGTVKSRIARARENLRALMVETCPEFADVPASEWFLLAKKTYGCPTIAAA